MNNNLPLILIVDDVPSNVELLTHSLHGNYRVKVAVDGKTALVIAQSDPRPDLILLDIIMPDLDGFEICKLLKADSRSEKIPIIFVTAKGEEQDEEYGLKLGAVDYIIKPFSIPITLARISNHIKLKQQANLLESLAVIDPLTHIPNRRLCNEKLETEWKRAVREKKHLSLLMIDIDYFKEYNDHYGHRTGDLCLQAVANALSSSVTRPGDVVARYGGEEFVAILPETNLEASKYIAEKLRQNIANLNLTHEFSGTAPFVTVSIGSATSCDSNKEFDFTTLLETADKMLYLSKKQGRNCVTVTIVE